MFKLRILSLLLLILNPVFGLAQDMEKLESYLDQARKDWGVPGMAVLIMKDGKPVLEKGFGVLEMNKPNAVNEHTIFAIASLSKAFTTTLMAQQVEHGTINWDDRVIDHLPDFRMFDPYVTREMKIEDLFAHRSGLHTFGGDLLWWGSTYSPKEVVERIRFLEPRQDFRSDYGYQNIMFLAGGLILEKLTGQTWQSLVQDSILTPLGMNRTTTSITLFNNMENIATPHHTWEGEQVTVPYRNVDNVHAAAALNSTVHDLGKWINWWLTNDASNPTIISKNSQNKLTSPVVAFPLSLRSQAFMPQRHFSGVALGWFTYDYYGRKVNTHSGGMDGMISSIAIVPEENLGIVVLTNSISSLASTMTYYTLDAFLGHQNERDWSREGLDRMKEAEERDRQNREKELAERKKESKPSVDLDAFTGTYHSQLYGDVRVTNDQGQLRLSLSQSPTLTGKMTHWHYDTFEIVLDDKTLPRGKVQFILDVQGNVHECRIDIPNPDFDFSELQLFKVN